jgi:hypothetical protein
MAQLPIPLQVTPAHGIKIEAAEGKLAQLKRQVLVAPRRLE